YKKAFGADTTETAHLLASATKIASATAMMSLVDDQLIALDDPVRKYLPKFGTVRGAITVRQLMAQTHGLPFSHQCIPMPEQRDGNGMTLEECVNIIAREDTVQFPPGSKQNYQPAVSYHLMGRIAEVATGQNWATLFEQRVTGPLEMKTFNYGTAKNKNPRVGGGGSCALQDYGNLLQMYLTRGVYKGRRVLSETSVAEMQKDQSQGAPFTPLHNNYAYGLTWWIDGLDEKKRPVQFSCAGAYGAVPWIHTQAGYGGFLLLKDKLTKSKHLYYELSSILNAMKP
ncbi:MAG: beta-lactamase family protein, partial [Nevskiales bacterium]|nr:beta-lactamase family protein [Nevskiales bacterium]